MKRVIIDTNALMAIADLKLNLFTEINATLDFPYQLFVLEGTIDELNKIIKEQRGKYKRAAKLILAILKAKNIGVIKEKGYVDHILVEHSKLGDLILTQDIILKKKLTKPYLTIRQKKKVILVR